MTNSILTRFGRHDLTWEQRSGGLLPSLPPGARSALLALPPTRRRQGAALLLRASPLPPALEQELVDEVRRCWEGVPLPRPLAALIDDARAIALLHAIERVHAWSEGPEACGRHLRISSLQPIEQALAAGDGGAVVITASFGAWQHIPAALARRGYRVGFVDLRPPQRRVARWPVPGPGLDLRVFPSTGGARPLVRFLREPRSLLVLVGDECTSVRSAQGALLGRPVRIGSTPFELARRVERPLLPVFAVRERDGHDLLVETAVKVVSTGRGDADLDATAGRWLKVVERHVRRRPDHYLGHLLLRHAARYDDPVPFFSDSLPAATRASAAG